MIPCKIFQRRRGALLVAVMVAVGRRASNDEEEVQNEEEEDDDVVDVDASPPRDRLDDSYFLLSFHLDGELAFALSLRCMAMVNFLLAGLSLFSCHVQCARSKG